jgi:glycerophosphoryl diester phosphodiesterase
MGNPWLERRVLNYAHQGGAREAPSSTLFAIRQAIANGADAIELDVHATADGEIVVCHDPTVDRTTQTTGRLADLTLDQVGQLDNAYWWVPGEVVNHDRDRPAADYIHRGKAPADHAFGIATLREVLEEFTGAFLNLDIKQSSPVVPAYEAGVAKLLQEFGRADDVVVASFSDSITDAFSELAPNVHTSCGTNATAAIYAAVKKGEPLPPTRHVALQVPPTFGDTTVVDEAFVDRAHDAGLAVHVWTIDEADEMRRLIDLGVDGIMTDRPSVLTTVRDGGHAASL